MRFLPSLNTLKTAANYTARSVAAGAVLGVPYFAFMAKVPASAFTAAQAAAAQTYGATLVGTYAAAISFTGAQLAIAVGYGAAAAAGILAVSKVAKLAYAKIFAAAPEPAQPVVPPTSPTVGYTLNELRARAGLQAVNAGAGSQEMDLSEEGAFRGQSLHRFAEILLVNQNNEVAPEQVQPVIPPVIHSPSASRSRSPEGARRRYLHAEIDPSNIINEPRRSPRRSPSPEF